MARHRAVGPRQQPDHPDDGCRIDGPGRALIVEGDIAARHRGGERAAGIGDAATGFAELIEDGGALRAPEVEAVGNAEGARAGAGDVPSRFRDRGLATFIRVERHVARIAVGRHRNPEVRVADTDHRRVAPGAEHGAGLDGGVVLLEDPTFRGDRGVIEERQQNFCGRRDGGRGRRTSVTQGRDAGIFLSPRVVELMGSVFAPDTLPGRPRGEAYGLSVRVVNDPVARNSFLSEGSFGWSGAFGTHFWVDRKEKLIAIAMTQTSNQEFLRDFENMVMQAVVGGSAPRSVSTK